MKFGMASILGLALVAGLLFMPLDAAAKPKKHSVASEAITLHVPNLGGQVRGGGTFSGVLDLTELNLNDNQLVGAGLLTGTLTDASGTTQQVAQDVDLPLQLGGCQPLTLTFLGPVAVDTEQSDPLVDLTSGAVATVSPGTADPNAVNLVGMLLCQVATLQASPDLLGQVLDLVNGLL